MAFENQANIPSEGVSKYSHEGLDESLVTKGIKSLGEALGILQKNKDFNNKYSNLSIGDLLPLMIKESLLDNSRKSKTGAIGYFQLKPDAIKDAERKLKELGITQSFPPKDPIDNCVLGIIYVIISKDLVKDALEGYSYSSEFDFFAYNGGASRLGGIVDEYKNENKNVGNNLVWDDFVSWLSGKLEKGATPTLIFSKEYNVYYRSWFKKDWSGDDSTIDFSGIKTKKSKIYEMINYVEKIKAIKETNQKEKSKIVHEYGNGKAKVIASSCTQRLSIVIDYDNSKDNFNGEGFIDRSWYNLKKSIGYNDKYKQVKAERGDGIKIMLKKAGIEPTKENVDKFYDINDLDEDEVIKLGAYYLLPNVEKPESQQIEDEVNEDSFYTIQAEKGDGVISMLKKAGIEPTKENILKFNSLNCLLSGSTIVIGEYYLLPNVTKLEQSEGNIVKKPENKVEKTAKDKPDFYKWLNGIEVKSQKLSGKVFILDPGHGGGDPGAIPVANDKDGKPITYTQSDIDDNQRVENGHGDGKLRVIEAKVTMDVSYRLAKLIKEHGGEVKITHYFQHGIDNENWTQSSNSEAPGLLDQLEYYDTWGDTQKGKFNEGSIDGLRKRVKVREGFKNGVKNDNVFFISIHADRLGINTNSVGINILHAKDSTGQKKFAEKLSKAMGNLRGMETTFGTREKGIYVLNPKVGAHNQNVLIELGNMNNQNTSYALRSGKTRQDYAEGIFRGMLGVASK